MPIDDLANAPLIGNLIELNNGNLLISFYREEGFADNIPTLYWVSMPDGNIIQQYNFWEDYTPEQAFITDVFISSTGNIIGAGMSYYVHEDTHYSGNAWMFSITQDGLLNCNTCVL